MSERSRRGAGLTIGLDLGSKHSQAVVVDERGEVVYEFRVRMRRRDLERRLGEYAEAVVIVEASGSSPWVSRHLEELGLEVVVSNPRKVRTIAHGEMKTDRHDAEHLARLGRADRKLLYPIQHRGQQARRDLVLLQSRDGLVRARVQLVNQVRGFARSLGKRLPSASTGALARRMHEQGKADLFPGLEVLLGVIQRLTAEIRSGIRRRSCSGRWMSQRLTGHS